MVTAETKISDKNVNICNVTVKDFFFFLGNMLYLCAAQCVYLRMFRHVIMDGGKNHQTHITDISF